MNKDKYFADMYVHLHQDSFSVDRGKLEKELYESSGVFSVHFDKDENRSAMIVSYNPEAASSDVLLEIIKKSYAGAVGVAGTLMRVSDSIATMNNK
ncbi:MAG: hypothetical protein KAT61_06985 [Gammaproteobacteria bacterium]|nr:hypothetical protein [Gammaproteobacteria bacterium]